MALGTLFSKRKQPDPETMPDPDLLPDPASDPELEVEEESPVFPSISALSRIRRIHEGAFEDLSGRRYFVWEFKGHDPRDAKVLNGWHQILNSIEWPVQVLIRQHMPDYSDISRLMVQSRPESMKTGRINTVANSLLDHLRFLEGHGGIVSRRWYVSAEERFFSDMESTVRSSGLNARLLEDSELSELYLSCLGGMGLGHRQEIFQAIEKSSDLEMNLRFAAVYEVNKWPRRISPLFLENFLALGQEMDVSIWISPVTLRESHSRLQMQLARHQGSRLAAEQKGKLVPPSVDLAISDISRISDGVERGTNRLFRRTMTVAIYGPDRDALRRGHETVTGYFRGNLSGLRLLRYRQGRGFSNVMPVVRQGMGEPDLTDGGTMRYLFPLGPSDMDHREGVLLGMDIRSKTPVFVDAFSPEAMNGHMVVMARSGAGKSYGVKLRVLREATRDVPVYLIDPEGEFGVITRELGGQVYVPGAKGFGLNPFLIGFTDEADLYKRIASLSSLIVMMLGDNLSDDLKATIDRCLVGFYNKELAEFEGEGRKMLGVGGISDFYAYLDTSEAREWGSPNLHHLLSVFATGSARFLLQGEGRDLMSDEAPVTSFNLKNLPNSLKPVATAVCSEVVWGMAVSNPRPRLLVVDECWTVLATPSGAESLITIVKRARKYRLGLITITQDVQDFLSEDRSGGVISSHAGRSLLQNSALKIAFSQDAAALPMVVEALALNAESAAFLAGSIRGQGVLVGPQGDSYPIQIVATNEENALVTDMGWLKDGSAEEPLPEVNLDDLIIPPSSGDSEDEGPAKRSRSRGLSIDRLVSERFADDDAPQTVDRLLSGVR